MTLPNQPVLDPLGVSRWQGVVDENLKSLDGRLGKVEEKLDEMPELIEERLNKVLNGHPKNSTVTFKWILEKIALPVILSGGSAGVAIYAILRFLANGSL